MRVISNAIIVLELSLELLMSLQIMKKTTALRSLPQKKRISNGYFYHLIKVYGSLLNEGY
jgi:hypothetical protein